MTSRSRQIFIRKVVINSVPAHVVSLRSDPTGFILAALAQFKPGSGMAWAQRHVEIDGEAEYGISVIFDAPPCEDTEDGEYPTEYVCDGCGSEADETDAQGACPECGHEGHEEDGWREKDFDDYEDGRNWSEHNGAWLIVEVFPENEPRHGVMIYDSLEDAFSAPELALCPAETV